MTSKTTTPNVFLASQLRMSGEPHSDYALPHTQTESGCLLLFPKAAVSGISMALVKQTVCQLVGWIRFRLWLICNFHWYL